MADSYVDKVAGELADLALADANATGDEKIVDMIGEILGASSQTLQEAYMTAVRVRRAEGRARELLAKRAGTPVRVKSRLLSDKDAQKSHDNDTIELGSDTGPAPQTSQPEKKEDLQSAEDAAFADVLNTLDEFLQSDEPEAEEEPSVKPSRPSRK